MPPVLAGSVDIPNRRSWEVAACPAAGVDLGLPRLGVAMDVRDAGEGRRAPRAWSPARVACSAMVVWAALWIAGGLYSLPAGVVAPGMDHGSYCESGDHPGPCPNLLPALLYSLTALAGGLCSVVVAVRARRSRPGARAPFVTVLSTWAVVLLALGVWAAREDDSTRLSAPGREFLVLAVVNLAVCLLLVVPVQYTGIAKRLRLRA